MRQKTGSFSIGRFHFTGVDLAALILFILLFGWYFYVIRFGVNAADEGFYYSVAMRVWQGDRLLVDEWQVSQFSAFFLLLPYRIYTAAAGSTEGIILFERILFVINTGILYWLLCSRYRRFGYWGIAGTALFCAFVPGDMFALFYLTMGLQWLMVLATFLFLPSEKPRSVFGWVLCGIALAWLVLAQPPFALTYLLYSAVVLIRNIRAKRGKPFSEPVLAARSWALITAGVVIVAVPVAVFLCVKSGIGNILRIFPELLTDSEYDFFGEHIANLLWKFLILCENFGYGNVAVWTLLLICSIAVQRMRKKEASPLPANGAGTGKKRQASAKKGVKAYAVGAGSVRLLFCAACVCMVSSYIYAIVSFAHNKNDTESHQLYLYYFYHSYPAIMFTAVCCKLLQKKIPGCAPFWWAVVLSELFNAYGSQVACSIFGVLLFPWMFYAAACLVKELKTAPVRSASSGVGAKAAVSRRLLHGMLAAGLCACICFESIGLYTMRFFLPIEHYEGGEVGEPVNRTLLRGPQKGLITNSRIFNAYEAYLSDLDRMQPDAAQRVYIMGTSPFAYLYLERRAGTYSTWFVADDAFDRQLRFMQLLPEKRPGLIYIPRIDSVTYRLPEEFEGQPDGLGAEEKLAWVRQYADCTVTEGKVGYIVQINAWRLPPLE